MASTYIIALRYARYTNPGRSRAPSEPPCVESAFILATRTVFDSRAKAQKYIAENLPMPGDAIIIKGHFSELRVPEEGRPFSGRMPLTVREESSSRNSSDRRREARTEPRPIYREGSRR